MMSDEIQNQGHKGISGRKKIQYKETFILDLIAKMCLKCLILLSMH